MDFLDLDIQKIFSESYDNIETTVEDWIEMMIDKYISDETQEILDHCRVLLGRSRDSRNLTGNVNGKQFK